MVQAVTLSEIITYLTGFRDEDWSILQSVAPQLEEWGPEIVNVFFETVYSLDETKKIFHDGERPKLEKAVANWYMNLIYGKYGEELWDWQKYIGFRHMIRGTRNIFMLGMMARVQQVFLKKCTETFDKEKAFEVYGAFHRITSSISALIAENYDNALHEGLNIIGISEKLIVRILQIGTKKMLEELKKNDK